MAPGAQTRAAPAVAGRRRAGAARGDARDTKQARHSKETAGVEESGSRGYVFSLIPYWRKARRLGIP